MLQEDGGEDFEAAARFLVHDGGHGAREVRELPARTVLWWGAGAVLLLAVGSLRGKARRETGRGAMWRRGSTFLGQTPLFQDTTNKRQHQHRSGCEVTAKG